MIDPNSPSPCDTNTLVMNLGCLICINVQNVYIDASCMVKSMHWNRSIEILVSQACAFAFNVRDRPSGSKVKRLKEERGKNFVEAKCPFSSWY